MAKIEQEIPNIDAGGTYLFDPKTGKCTLVPENDATEANAATNKEDLAASQD
jgi:hypothetical protein